MQRTIQALLVATALLQPVVAWAETPSEAEAKQVEEAVKTYGPRVLSKQGVLRVSPDGDGYRLALDMAKLMSDAVAPMAIKEAAPRVFKLIAQPDGMWAYDSAGPFSLATEYLAANRSATLSVETETGTIKGLFDPAVVFPRRADIGFTNGVVSLRDARDALKIGIKEADLSSTAKDLPEARGDIDATFSMRDVTATHGTFPQPEVRITAARINGSYKLGKLDLAGLKAILHFWRVTAPDQSVETLTGIQRKEFDALFAKHVPMIDEIGGTVVATNLSASEGGKGFKLEKLDYQSRWEGLGGLSALVVGARIANLGIDPGIWPKGLEAILPQEAALNVRVSGFDMGALWKDLGQLRTSKESALLPRDHYSKILLPDRKIQVDIADSFIRSSFYDLTLSGQLRSVLGAPEQGYGLLAITAKDLDGTVKYLQDNIKTVPIFERLAFMALMAKGLGKPGPDGTMLWEIKLEGANKVTINGQELRM